MPLDNTAGYLEQGYANMAAAPMEMQLMEMQSRRAQLSNLQRSDREGARRENKDLEDQREVDDYIFKSKEMENLPPEQFDAGMAELWRNNTGWRDNQVIDDSIGSRYASDDMIADRSLKLKQRELGNKEADLGLKGIEKDEENFDSIAKAARLQTDLSLKTVEQSMTNFKESQFLSKEERKKNISSSIYNAVNSSLNDEQKTMMVGASNEFASSDDPLMQEASLALGRVAHAIGISSELNRAGSAMINRNAGLLNQLSSFIPRDANKNPSINLKDLENPEKVNETISKINALLPTIQGFEQKDLDKFRPLLNSAAVFKKTADDSVSLQKKLFDDLPFIRKNIKSLDPDLQQQARDKLAFMVERSNDQLGYAEAGAKEVIQQEGDQKKQDEINDRILDNRVKLARATEAEKTGIRAQIALDYKRSFGEMKSREQALGMAMKVIEDSQQSTLEGFGITGDSNVKEIADAILEYKSRGGQSSSGARDF